MMYPRWVTLANPIFARCGLVLWGVLMAMAGNGLAAESPSLPEPASFGLAHGGESTEERQQEKQMVQAMFDLMKNADSVSVFRIDASGKIDKTGKHAITGPERDGLVAIFLDPASYYRGLYAVSEPPPDLGIEFKRNDQRLVLECAGLFKGEFNGTKIQGMLMESALSRLNDWRGKYWVEK